MCVYEGWKSLQKGVERQRAANFKAYEALKKRKNEQFRKETVNKYARLNDGSRVKVEQAIDDYYDEGQIPEEDVPLEGTLDRTQRLFVDYVRAHDVVVTSY